MSGLQSTRTVAARSAFVYKVYRLSYLCLRSRFGVTIRTAPITERPQLPYPAALLTVFWPAPLGNPHWHPHHRPLRVCVRQAAAPSDQRIAVLASRVPRFGMTAALRHQFAQPRRGEADRACDLVPTPADVVLSAAPGDERAGRAALKPITIAWQYRSIRSSTSQSKRATESARQDMPFGKTRQAPS